MRPRTAAICRAIEARLDAVLVVVLRFDESVDLRRALASVDRQPGAADVTSRQALGQLRPGFSPVGRLMKTAFRSAADRLPNMPAALISRGVDDVRILRVEHDVGDPG